MSPFVFLPGTLCDERLWHHQLPVLRDTHVVNLRTQSRLDEMLKAVSDAPFASFVLVGFSMGGYVAQEFALRNPERVKALIILGSSCHGYPAKEKEIAKRMLPILEKGQFKGLSDTRLKQYLHPQSHTNSAIRDLVQEMMGSDANEVYFNQLKATLDRRDLSTEIHKVACPFTIVAGKEDQIVPVESILKTSTYHPRANILVFTDCGHFIPLEQPDKVNELLLQYAE